MMKTLYTKLILLFAVLLSSLNLYAAEPTKFEVNAPMMVAVGETFRVEFSLNAEPDDDSFVGPDFRGFDLLAGPALSKGSSIQIINGSMTKSVNYTYTYVLVAQSAGNASIDRAVIKVDKKLYQTKPLAIEVVEERPSQQHSSQQGSSGAVQGGNIAPDDILLRMELSRKSVFRGEPVHATIKLYYRTPIVGAEGEKMPSFNGFWAQNIKNPASQGEVERKTLNGKIYEVQTLYDYLLYPQQSGQLTIEPAELTAIAQVVVQSNRPRDPFFGGGHEVYNVRRELSTPRVTIDVKSLPAGAPSSFTGVVGELSMESSVSAQEIMANSSATYTLRISGHANLSLLPAPKLELAQSFEQYNVKTTESINSTAKGSSGYKQFEYPFIARSEGDFEIQPVEFTYFNTKSMSYETLRSPSYTIKVSPDTESAQSGDVPVIMGGGNVSRKEVKLLGSDIHFIMLGEAKLMRYDNLFVVSWHYPLILILMVLITLGLYIYMKRYMRLSKNIVHVKGKRANKVAIQRFKLAKGFMDGDQKREFYEEVLRAMWGYMSDKFNIPVANLTKESVREELSKRGASADLRGCFSTIITICEEAQYSPMTSAHLSEVYNDALEYISRVESEIKR